MTAHRRFRVALFACTALLLPITAHAYGVTGAGGKLGVTNPEDLDQTVMLGGHVEMENETRIHLMPNLMYWHANHQTDVNPNFDVYYHFGEQTHTTPYLGGGIGLEMRSSSITDRSETDLGANFIGGLRFPGRSNHYFVEGRYTASDVSQIAVLGGITFHTR